jgi:integrase
MPLAMLTIGAIEKYIDQRTAEGAARTTVKKELRALGAVLRHAKRVGLWAGDVQRVIPEYADDYQPRKRALSWQEALRLLQALEAPNNAQHIDRARNRAAAVAFMLATGARWGEVTRARREDVADHFVTLRGTKTKAAARAVPIVKMTRSLLDYALSAVGNRKGKLFDSWQNPNRDLEVACTQAGIPKASPNDLRRSLATWLRVLGVDISVIAAVLGHTTSRMVERVYGRLSPEELKARMGGRLLDQQRGKGSVPKLLPAPPDSKKEP